MMYRVNDTSPNGIYSMETRAFPNGSSKRGQETIITHRPPASIWPPQDRWPQPQTINTNPLETPHTNGLQVSVFLADIQGKKKRFAGHSKQIQQILNSHNQSHINDITNISDEASGLAIFS